jgi:hypothetical protein
MVTALLQSGLHCLGTTQITKPEAGAVKNHFAAKQ